MAMHESKEEDQVTSGARLVQRALREATGLRVEVTLLEGDGVFVARASGLAGGAVEGGAEHRAVRGWAGAAVSAVSHLVTALDRAGVLREHGLVKAACPYELPEGGALPELVERIIERAQPAEVAMLLRAMRAAQVCPYPSAKGHFPEELEQLARQLPPL